MESMQQKKSRKPVRIHKFSASFDFPRHIYELIIDDGKITRAICLDSKNRKIQVYSSRHQDLDSLRTVLIGLMFLNGVDVLKRIYEALDDGAEKEFIKDFRNEIVAKLTF